MNEISIYISFVVAILAIAYPILFQVVTKLDEKYFSILIVDLFHEERVRKLFSIFLISSLISILIWTFKIPPIIRVDGFNFFIENSASIAVLISTILLITSFFLFVNKILIYYRPSKFIIYLMNKHKKKNSDEKKSVELLYFKAIADVLIQSIRQQNEKIARTISDFINGEFQKHREKFYKRTVEYPFDYYEITYRTTEEIALLKINKLSFLENDTVGGLWLLGELKGYMISEKTYYWLWKNIITALKYEKDDMIINYWQRAHNFISYKLGPIETEYSEDFEITNNEVTSKRNEERKRFLEFHYALGGLLLYKERYDCLARIFNYTICFPPKYELLPEKMGEIIEMYIQFRDPYEMNYRSISQRYYFPEVEGLNADGIIKMWICKYLAILFLRQYTIFPHLITMKPLELPAIPETQREKKFWIDHLEYFSQLVGDNLENSKLINKLRFEFIAQKWCKENEKLYPFEFLNKLKKKVTEEYEKTKIEQTISKNKLDKFIGSTNNILTRTTKLYDKINNAEIIKLEYDKWYCIGEKAIVDKSAFSDDQDSNWTNYDSFFAENISEKYQKTISETFFIKKSISYLIKREEIFDAIDNLKINNKDYLIVGFGQHLPYYIDSLAITGLTEEKYKDIDIVNYPVCHYELTGESFFILKKSDLPKILYKKIEDTEIEKYSLALINEDINLYASIIDLNQSYKLKEELASSAPKRDLNKSILISIAFITEIRWKKNIEVIQIRSFSQYRERGLPNKLADVKAIQEQKKSD